MTGAGGVAVRRLHHHSTTASDAPITNNNSASTTRWRERARRLASRDSDREPRDERGLRKDGSGRGGLADKGSSGLPSGFGFRPLSRWVASAAAADDGHASVLGRVDLGLVHRFG